MQLDTPRSGIPRLDSPRPEAVIVRPPAGSVSVWPVNADEGSKKPSDAPDDHALLRSIAAGDRVAFRALYGRHAGRIRSYLERAVGGRGPAEDILQEVFLGVWRQAAGYRSDRGVVVAWIFGIVRNKLYDARRRGAIQIEALEGVVANLESPGDARRDDRIALHAALDELPERERRAVTMTYIGGFTYDETAARLDVPLGTLKSRLRSGLDRLRRSLGTLRDD